jgi:DNA-binding response OmpR family regulator
MHNRDRNPAARRRRSAFVVEDDIQTLRLMQELAESAGLQPVMFTRLASVRRALRDEVPAVMVVDDDLPDGRGADLAREVHADPRMRDVPVLICTAAGSERRREIERHAAVIQKPFVLVELERVFSEAAGG